MNQAAPEELNVYSNKREMKRAPEERHQDTNRMSSSGECLREWIIISRSRSNTLCCRAPVPRRQWMFRVH
jgi:hypothetical protein